MKIFVFNENLCLPLQEAVNSIQSLPDWYRRVSGDVKVSTGAVKRDKRAVVAQSTLKGATFNLNAKNKPNLAFAA